LAAWPELPEAIKAGILPLVRASTAHKGVNIELNQPGPGPQSSFDPLTSIPD